LQSDNPVDLVAVLSDGDHVFDPTGKCPGILWVVTEMAHDKRTALPSQRVGHFGIFTKGEELYAAVVLVRGFRILAP
jgi:hypothetical protein